MPNDETFEPAGQICPECTCNNLLSATRCEVCGAPLRGRPAPLEPDEAQLDDAGDSAEPIDAIPSDQRESLGQFHTNHEADLAAGLLRSEGIAVEVAAPMPYGSRTREIWTHRRDAARARQILVEVNHRATRNPN